MLCFEGSVHYPLPCYNPVVPGICWSYFSSFGFIAPIAPIITGTTLDFTFQILQLLILLCFYMLLLLDLVVCHIYQNFSLLLLVSHNYHLVCWPAACLSGSRRTTGIYPLCSTLTLGLGDF